MEKHEIAKTCLDCGGEIATHRINALRCRTCARMRERERILKRELRRRRKFATV